MLRALGLLRHAALLGCLATRVAGAQNPSSDGHETPSMLAVAWSWDFGSPMLGLSGEREMFRVGPVLAALSLSALSRTGDGRTLLGCDYTKPCDGRTTLHRALARTSVAIAPQIGGRETFALGWSVGYSVVQWGRGALKIYRPASQATIIDPEGTTTWQWTSGYLASFGFRAFGGQNTIRIDAEYVHASGRPVRSLVLSIGRRF